MTSVCDRGMNLTYYDDVCVRVENNGTKLYFDHEVSTMDGQGQGQCSIPCIVLTL